MNDFDFDEWADLYKRDPQAFEARRQTVLAIELAKNRPLAGPARDMLRRLDTRLQQCSDEERLPTSLRFMTESLGQLCGRMDELATSVNELGSTLSTRQAATTR